MGGGERPEDQAPRRRSLATSGVDRDPAGDAEDPPRIGIRWSSEGVTRAPGALEGRRRQIGGIFIGATSRPQVPIHRLTPLAKAPDELGFADRFDGCVVVRPCGDRSADLHGLPPAASFTLQTNEWRKPDRSNDQREKEPLMDPFGASERTQLPVGGHPRERSRSGAATSSASWSIDEAFHMLDEALRFGYGD